MIDTTAKQHNKILRAVKALNDVREELEKDNPGADINWYLEDSNNLNLMRGEAHDHIGRGNYHNVIHNYMLINSSGGGW